MFQSNSETNTGDWQKKMLFVAALECSLLVGQRLEGTPGGSLVQLFTQGRANSEEMIQGPQETLECKDSGLL